jgi:hypothetical protein
MQWLGLEPDQSCIASTCTSRRSCCSREYLESHFKEQRDVEMTSMQFPPTLELGKVGNIGLTCTCSAYSILGPYSQHPKCVRFNGRKKWLRACASSDRDFEPVVQSIHLLSKDSAAHMCIRQLFQAGMCLKLMSI